VHVLDRAISGLTIDLDSKMWSSEFVLVCYYDMAQFQDEDSV